MGIVNVDLMFVVKNGLFDIDVIGWQDYIGIDQLDKFYSKCYRDYYCLGGLKIIFDGLLQGCIVWCIMFYLILLDGQNFGYKGYFVIFDICQV